MLSESEFRLFREMIYEECGAAFNDSKQGFLESRLRRRMENLGIQSPAEYYHLVRHSAHKSQELPALLDALMICETSFFRNAPQFDLLRQEVLPAILERKQRLGSRQIRVWSAGCSTGQEPYSAAIALLETLPPAQGWSIRVFASDLSFTALERAHCGLYTLEQLKGLDTAQVNRYFRLRNGMYQLVDEIRQKVIFDYHNLKNDNGMRGMDIIFCRNVMIYFDMEEQRRLVDRFASCLVPGGYLFLGHAESVQSFSGRFTMLHRNKGIAYKVEG